MPTDRTRPPTVVVPAKAGTSLSRPRVVPGGCFTPLSFGPCSLSGGCSAVVSRGARFVAAPRGSNPASRNNPQPATPSPTVGRKNESKLHPTPTRNNRDSTSKLFRRSAAGPQARDGREKTRGTERIDSSRRSAGRRPFDKLRGSGGSALTPNPLPAGEGAEGGQAGRRERRSRMRAVRSRRFVRRASSRSTTSSGARWRKVASARRASSFDRAVSVSRCSFSRR